MDSWKQADFYKRLGAEPEADAAQLKRAYFGMVRQYPPERFPEEFKAVREAYETLSDPKKREEYDRRSSLPEHSVFLFELAVEAREQGRDGEAAKQLEALVKIYPKVPLFQEELAETYQLMDKNGKAMKLLESLCEQYPESSLYAERLARSLQHRGWTNKAQAEFERAIELDRLNLEAWSGLLANFSGPPELSLARQALAAAREKGEIHFHIYQVLFGLMVHRKKTEEAEEILEDLRLAADKGKIPPQELDEHVYFILSVVQATSILEFFPSIKALADRLLNPSEDLLEILEEVELAYTAVKLREQGFSDLLHDLVLTKFYLRHSDEHDEEMIINLQALEFHLLTERETHRSQLLRLREEYPRMYELNAAFFNEALRVKNPEKMMHQRLNALTKAGYSPFAEGEDPEDAPALQEPPETFRRAEPKVGRNQPCPCGSGKKYKKCCGA